MTGCWIGRAEARAAQLEQENQQLKLASHSMPDVLGPSAQQSKNQSAAAGEPKSCITN